MKLHQVDLSAQMLLLMNVTNHSNNLLRRVNRVQKKSQNMPTNIPFHIQTTIELDVPHLC